LFPHRFFSSIVLSQGSNLCQKILALHTSEAGQYASSEEFGYVLNTGANNKFFVILDVARLHLG